MVKVKEFTHEEDPFDDLFQGSKSFAQVLYLASLQLSPDDINAFHVYRNKILLNVTLDLLQIEPIREITPSVSLEGSSKENFDEEMQEK